MQYFGEPEGQVKIQLTSKNVQRYFTLERVIRELLSNIFFSKTSDLTTFLIFRAVGALRRVQISCDIIISSLYMYSTKQRWIINLLVPPGGMFTSYM